MSEPEKATVAQWRYLDRRRPYPAEAAEREAGCRSCGHVAHRCPTRDGSGGCQDCDCPWGPLVVDNTAAYALVDVEIARLGLDPDDWAQVAQAAVNVVRQLVNERTTP